jgi:glutathione S-transferase
MQPQVTALTSVPDFARGQVRDIRVRWALEEAGEPYEQVLLDAAVDLASPAYRRWQPFGQVPAYRNGDIELFESGAIVLHIAEKSEALAPRDHSGRARVTTWVLAALNTLEPYVSNVVLLDLFYAGEPWIEGRRPGAMAELEQKLNALAAWLGEREFLEDRFTAGDLIMTTVLHSLVGAGILQRFPTLDAYRRRCQARPAFQRALNAQLNAFDEHDATMQSGTKVD